MQRGTLTAGNTAILSETFEQCWGLDATDNWQNFQQDDNGNGVWDLVQGRVSNAVNEITLIHNSVGASWVTPGYDAAGNMTTMPQPTSPGSSYTAVYDAWNRLVGLSAGGSQVATYQYDGRGARTLKNTYSSGVLSSTKHLYYTSAWQIIEERLGISTSADRQFVWGLRYIDDVVVRDRDPSGSGILTERFYSLQDPNWNVTGLVDATGSVQERYAYNAYGTPTVLTPVFGFRLGTLWSWETRYAGYRWDEESSLYQVRNRSLNTLVSWLQRDPLREESGLNLYAYVGNAPLDNVDTYGDVDIAVQFASPASPYGFSIYFSLNASVTRCPVEVAGSIFAGLEWQPPGLREFYRVLGWLGIDRLIHLEFGARGGGVAKINYSECFGISSTKFCFRVEIFGRVEFRRWKYRDTRGRFTRFRVGGGASGGGELCLNFCNGEFTLEGDFSWSVYLNFGYNKYWNRTYNVGGGYSGNFSFGSVEKFALLKNYCNKSPNPRSCCCIEKYGYGGPTSPR